MGAAPQGTAAAAEASQLEVDYYREIDRQLDVVQHMAVGNDEKLRFLQRVEDLLGLADTPAPHGPRGAPTAGRATPPAASARRGQEPADIDAEAMDRFLDRRLARLDRRQRRLDQLSARLGPPCCTPAQARRSASAAPAIERYRSFQPESPGGSPYRRVAATQTAETAPTGLQRAVCPLCGRGTGASDVATQTEPPGTPDAQPVVRLQNQQGT